MSIADILVNVDSSEQSVETLRVGIEISRQFDARLSAIYPIQPLAQLPYVGASADVVVLNDLMEDQTNRMELTREKLVHQADDKLVKLHWHSPTGSPSRLTASSARLNDLLVVSQGDPSRYQGTVRGLNGSVLLDTGRPTLVVPYIGCRAFPFNNILVAWDGSRTATRAINDSLPFLRLAESVEVTTVHEHTKQETRNCNNNEDICEHLLRHGVGVKSSRLESTDVDIGNTLLNHVADSGANLLVIGAYGHSRAREFLLGGVTRCMLRSMTVPVLMSH
ncbi:MAG: universal stress protein [Granulosicoccus sp.]|nr:universal stress protein [Granulosicoccus sp.]